jgi:type 1 glutamine amidotransferase
MDESTYAGGDMVDHPIAWCHNTVGGGRSWYTALGHTQESYDEPLFQQHLLGGILTAAGAAAADCSVQP